MQRGLIDSSVVIGLDRLDAKRLPVDLPLYTRNIDDLRRLDHLLTIVAV